MAYVYNLGAGLNDAYSEYKLGKLYFDGVFYEQNYEQALKHFKKSFALNPNYSSYLLGLMYSQGLSVRRNRKKAFEYFLEGSNENLKSKKALAKIYSSESLAHACGVKKDLNIAEKYFREYLDGMKNKTDKIIKSYNEHGQDSNTRTVRKNFEKMRTCKRLLKDVRQERREKIKDYIEEAKQESKNQEGKTYDLSFIPQR